MKKRYYDWGYLLADAFRRGFWGCIFLAALFILVTGQITL